MVWEDRREGYPLRIYYRGKDPDPTWMKWDSSDYELSTIDSVVMFGHPSIHALPNGKVFSVYVEERPIGGELYGSWIDSHPSEHIESDMVSNPGGSCLSFSSHGWQTTIASYGDRTVAFWPYLNTETSGSLPVYFRIYDDGVPIFDELPVVLSETGLNYQGINLSATAGSDHRIYLVCRLMKEEFPLGHIFLFTLDILTGELLNIEDLTPNETRVCRVPYIAVSPRADGNDLIFITYAVSDVDFKAVFISNMAGEWSEPTVLSAGDNSSGHPCVAINGDFVDFVYESPNNSIYNPPISQIYHQRYDLNTGVLSEAVQVTHSGDLFNMRPVIASDSYGNLHLVYITNRINPQTFGDEEVYYSIFDAAPRSPEGFEFDRDKMVITWRENPEPDISHYRIVFNGRDTVVTDARFEIEQTSFDDFVFSARAVDLSGQESRPATYRSTIRGLFEITGAPRDLIIGKNYPNPFNATTTIPISPINMSYPLYLEVFDITGKIVKTFTVNDASDKEVVWNGRNDYARPVSTGVYFYRLRSDSDFGKTKSMTLIK